MNTNIISPTDLQLNDEHVIQIKRVSKATTGGRRMRFRAIMEQIGITDILTKNTGSTNPINVVKAVEYGLKQLRDPLTVSRQRGIKIKDLFD